MGLVMVPLLIKSLVLPFCPIGAVLRPIDEMQRTVPGYHAVETIGGTPCVLFISAESAAAARKKLGLAAQVGGNPSAKP